MAAAVREITMLRNATSRSRNDRPMTAAKNSGSLSDRTLAKSTNTAVTP